MSYSAALAFMYHFVDFKHHTFMGTNSSYFVHMHQAAVDSMYDIIQLPRLFIHGYLIERSLAAPGKGAIEYQKVRLMRDLENNPYTGDPRPEFDEAWARLIERTFLYFLG
jgi:hypothetical protein